MNKINKDGSVTVPLDYFFAPGVTETIARIADGDMRQALVILEQITLVVYKLINDTPGIQVRVSCTNN